MRSFHTPSRRRDTAFIAEQTNGPLDNSDMSKKQVRVLTKRDDPAYAEDGAHRARYSRLGPTGRRSRDGELIV